ncbi:MAG TPA: DUF962 domain-containing protein [Limnobacter sp.]|uniref:DUF962 domain-containing protein n=1 Tax=Limnobacter sp. TaxID=2003368 RepID=UPI002EDB5DE2
MPKTGNRFQSFSDFYPFYLAEHSNLTCRRLHFVGSSIALYCLIRFGMSGNPAWFFGGLIQGYAFAWVGHFFFEKNKPATFKYPLWSFMGDWVMYKDILTRKIPF